MSEENIVYHISADTGELLSKDPANDILQLESELRWNQMRQSSRNFLTWPGLSSSSCSSLRKQWSWSRQTSWWKIKIDWFWWLSLPFQNVILGKTFHQETEDDFGSVSLDPRSDVAVLIKLFKCCNDIIQNLGLLWIETFHFNFISGKIFNIGFQHASICYYMLFFISEPLISSTRCY